MKLASIALLGGIYLGIGLAFTGLVRWISGRWYPQIIIAWPWLVVDFMVNG